MEGLTNIQKEVIKSAMIQRDFCTVAHGNTMNSLVNRNIANWTSGFGYKFGAIIELTEKGKRIQEQLTKQNEESS